MAVPVARATVEAESPELIDTLIPVLPDTAGSTPAPETSYQT